MESIKNPKYKYIKLGHSFGGLANYERIYVKNYLNVKI